MTPFPPSTVVRLYNFLFRRRRRSPFDSSIFLEDAVSSTGGLRDFGSDKSFLRGLESLCFALNAATEAQRLSPFGALVARSMIHRLLCSRLKLEAYWHENKEDLSRLQHDMTPPLVIVGLARTGTTMLHRLLAHSFSGQFFSLLSYEALDCVPNQSASLFGRLSGALNLRRFAACTAALAMDWIIAPRLASIHPLNADAPEEEILLLDLNFASQTFEAMFDVPEYTQWIESEQGLETVSAGYLYARRALIAVEHQKILAEGRLRRQDGGTRRWLLKSPMHMEYLAALDEAFPNALIIKTSRSLLHCLPSFCSMTAHLRSVTSTSSSGVRVAQQWVPKIHRMLSRSAAYTGSPEPSFSVVDLRYEQIISPSSCKNIENALDRLGLTDCRFSSAQEREIVQENRRRQGNGSGHKYSLETFGLSLSDLQERFQEFKPLFE